MKQLILALTDDQHRKLKVKAFRSGQSMVSLVRHWIDNVEIEVHPVVAWEEKIKENLI